MMGIPLEEGEEKKAKTQEGRQLDLKIVRCDGCLSLQFDEYLQ